MSTQFLISDFIDFHRRVVTFHDNLVAVALICDSKFGYARSVKREIIPAESEITILVKLSKVRNKMLSY